MLGGFGLYFVFRGSNRLTSSVNAAAASLRKLGSLSKAADAELSALTFQYKRLQSQIWASGLTAVVAGTAFIKLTSAAGKFEGQVKQLNYVLKPTTDQMASMKKQLLDMGGKVEFSSTNLAKGATEMARAGFSFIEVQKSIPIMADVMSAGGTNIKQTQELITQTLRLYNRDATAMRQDMDRLAYIANETAADFGFLVKSMPYAGRAAAVFGSTMEDILSTTGMLAPIITSATSTGMTLSQFMMNLGKVKTPKIQDMMSDMGMAAWDISDSTGKALHPTMMLYNMITNLDKATAKYNAKKREQVRIEFLIAQLGTRSAAVAALEWAASVRTASGEMTKNIPETIARMNAGMAEAVLNGGELARQAKIVRESWEGATKRLDTAFDTLKIKAGYTFLERMLQVLEKMINVLTTLSTLDEGSGGAYSAAASWSLALISGGAIINVLRKIPELVMTATGMRALVKEGGRLTKLIQMPIEMGGSGFTKGIPGMAKVGATGLAQTAPLGVIAAGVLKIVAILGLTYLAASYIKLWLEEKSAKDRTEQQKMSDERRAFKMFGFHPGGGQFWTGGKEYSTNKKGIREFREIPGVVGSRYEKAAGSLIAQAMHFQESEFGVGSKGFSDDLMAKTAREQAKFAMESVPDAFKGVSLDEATGVMSQLLRQEVNRGWERTGEYDYTGGMLDAMNQVVLNTDQLEAIKNYVAKWGPNGNPSMGPLNSYPLVGAMGGEGNFTGGLMGPAGDLITQFIYKTLGIQHPNDYLGGVIRGSSTAKSLRGVFAGSRKEADEETLGGMGIGSVTSTAIDPAYKNVIQSGASTGDINVLTSLLEAAINKSSGSGKPVTINLIQDGNTIKSIFTTIADIEGKIFDLTLGTI